VKQALADGCAYTYSYKPQSTDPINTAEVRTPDGRLFVINITNSASTVRERDISNHRARVDQLP
jgi:hypothetical protein